MHLIHGSITDPGDARRVVPLEVERITLAKRVWRGTAADGTEFGFELDRPLKHGETFHQTADVRYVIEQRNEPVLEVELNITPSAAAGIGWAVGNLHLELQAEATRLLAADDPAVRKLFERLNVPYRAATAVFRPGRFVRGEQVMHDIGPSHKH